MTSAAILLIIADCTSLQVGKLLEPSSSPSSMSDEDAEDTESKEDSRERSRRDGSHNIDVTEALGEKSSDSVICWSLGD